MNDSKREQLNLAAESAADRAESLAAQVVQLAGRYRALAKHLREAGSVADAPLPCAASDVATGAVRLVASDASLNTLLWAEYDREHAAKS